MRTCSANLLITLFIIAPACTGSSGGALPPDAIAPDAALSGVRHVPLTGCGWSYVGEFGIGGDTFRLMVDTGSQILGVAAVGCTSCSAQGVAPLYAPGPGAMDQHRPVSERYGDGSLGWDGELYTDLVTASTFPAVSLAFTAITSQMNFFYNGRCGDPQGILGLDAVLDPRGAPTNVLHELAAAGAKDEFAMHYCLGTGDFWFQRLRPRG